jgi:hypothetical protein
MTKDDYIHLFKEACGGKCNAEYNPCAYRQAADSLAALKPLTYTIPDGQPLYALDEANIEDAPLS